MPYSAFEAGMATGAASRLDGLFNAFGAGDRLLKERLKEALDNHDYALARKIGKQLGLTSSFDNEEFTYWDKQLQDWSKRSPEMAKAANDKAIELAGTNSNFASLMAPETRTNPDRPAYDDAKKAYDDFMAGPVARKTTEITGQGRDVLPFDSEAGMARHRALDLKGPTLPTGHPMHRRINEKMNRRKGLITYAGPQPYDIRDDLDKLWDSGSLIPKGIVDANGNLTPYGEQINAEVNKKRGIDPRPLYTPGPAPGPVPERGELYPYLPTHPVLGPLMKGQTEIPFMGSYKERVREMRPGSLPVQGPPMLATDRVPLGNPPVAAHQFNPDPRQGSIPVLGQLPSQGSVTALRPLEPLPVLGPGLGIPVPGTGNHMLNTAESQESHDREYNREAAQINNATIQATLKALDDRQEAYRQQERLRRLQAGTNFHQANQTANRPAFVPENVQVHPERYRYSPDAKTYSSNQGTYHGSGPDAGRPIMPAPPDTTNASPGQTVVRTQDGVPIYRAPAAGVRMGPGETFYQPTDQPGAQFRTAPAPMNVPPGGTVFQPGMGPTFQAPHRPQVVNPGQTVVAPPASGSITIPPARPKPIIVRPGENVFQPGTGTLHREPPAPTPEPTPRPPVIVRPGETLVQPGQGPIHREPPLPPKPAPKPRPTKRPAPVKTRPGETVVDPNTGGVIYRNPATPRPAPTPKPTDAPMNPQQRANEISKQADQLWPLSRQLVLDGVLTEEEYNAQLQAKMRWLQQLNRYFASQPQSAPIIIPPELAPKIPTPVPLPARTPKPPWWDRFMPHQATPAPTAPPVPRAPATPAPQPRFTPGPGGVVPVPKATPQVRKPKGKATAEPKVNKDKVKGFAEKHGF